MRLKKGDMTEKSDSVITVLKKVGVILSDSHFVGTSGRHMGVYLNKDALFPHAKVTSKIGRMFADKYKGKKIDVVVGPAMGGIILSQWTAFHLSRLEGREVHGVYTEKTKDNDQVFKRGYERLVKNKRVLVVEDLTTTGGSAKKVVSAVRSGGGKIVSVCVMVNRDRKLVNSRTMGVKFSSLGFFPAKSYLEKDCPFCKRNIPVNTEVGHGREYLEKRITKKIK